MSRDTNHQPIVGPRHPLITDPIAEFQGPYRFLSNFWPVSIGIFNLEQNDRFDIYPSVEHAYQASKFYLQSDRDAIRSTITPGNAKRIARTMQYRTRRDWDDVKLAIMEGLLIQKFYNRGPAHDWLRKKLEDTKPRELIEGE